MENIDTHKNWYLLGHENAVTDPYRMLALSRFPSSGGSVPLRFGFPVNDLDMGIQGLVSAAHHKIP